MIEEVGYVQLDRVQANLLFQVICNRYERNQPIILTSNKAFGEWGQVFAEDSVMASAALDRILPRRHGRGPRCMSSNGLDGLGGILDR